MPATKMNRGIHAERHPYFVDGCFNCKLLSVSISPSATPTRSGAMSVQATNDLAKQWDRDIPAYQSLVRDGLQPETVDGAADLMARAETKDEVEHNVVYTPTQRKEIEAAKELTGGAF